MQPVGQLRRHTVSVYVPRFFNTAYVTYYVTFCLIDLNNIQFKQ